MKKFFALLLVVLMLLPSVVACGKDKEDTPPTTTTTTAAPVGSTPKPDDGNDDEPGSNNSSNIGGSTDNSSTPEGSVPGTDDSDNPGTGDSSIPGTDDSSNPGTGDSSIPGTGDSSNPGTDDSSNPGTDDSSNPGTDDSSNPGTDDSSNPGTGDSSNPGTGDSSDQGTGDSSDQGTGDSSNQGGTDNPGYNPDDDDDYVDIEPAPTTLKNWSGKTLNILATIWGDVTEPGAPWSQVELVVKPGGYADTTGFGQTINAAVLRRADFIKSEYGVDLNWINARSAQISTLLSKAIVGGTEATQYHIAMPRMMEAQTIVAANSIHKLNGREYIDLSKSYYNQVARESYTIYGTTLFVAGDFSFLDEQTSFLTYYNVAMTEGIDDFPDLYQMVIDGKWTIDKMTNAARVVTKNVGDPMWTDEDTYGYGTTSLNHFFQYSGIQQVSVRDEQYIISLNDPQVTTLIDKILEITGSDWARTSWDGGFGALQNAFVEGRLLFYDEVVQKTDYFTNQNDEFKVGVLPSPKLTEGQESYYTPCSYQSVVMCIPKATPDRAMSDYFFEVLSYTGQKYVMQAYKQQMRGKLNPDTATQSMNIIENYIFANLCYDQGYMWGWNGLLTSTQTASYSSGKNNFTAAYEQDGGAARDEIENWNLAWLDHTD